MLLFSLFMIIDLLDFILHKHAVFGPERKYTKFNYNIRFTYLFLSVLLAKQKIKHTDPEYETEDLEMKGLEIEDVKELLFVPNLRNI